MSFELQKYVSGNVYFKRICVLFIDRGVNNFLIHRSHWISIREFRSDLFHSHLYDDVISYWKMNLVLTWKLSLGEGPQISIHKFTNLEFVSYLVHCKS